MNLLQKAPSQPDSLSWGERPEPRPNPGEVVIAIHATALVPTDGKDLLPTSPGGGYSGVIESLGDGVENLKIGDAVFGLLDDFAPDPVTDYRVVAASELALKPRLLDYLQAATVPLPALAAWQGLLERGNLQNGQRVLIRSVARGAGRFAVQLARWRGAYVIATAPSADRHFLGLLGADEVIHPITAHVTGLAQNLDLVFDCLGGGNLARSLVALKADGKLVTIAARSASDPDPRVRNAYLRIRSNGPQLAQIADLIDAGEIRAG